jgi:hypothetical protein
MSALFRTMAQELQRKGNAIERLENEMQIMNQSNYIEKLELIQKLELLQREMEILKIPKQIAKEKSSKDKNNKKKKERRGFFSKKSMETIPEQEDEVTNLSGNEDSLVKTLQQTEETIESFKKSIDHNIQNIQHLSFMRDSRLSSFHLDELYSAVMSEQERLSKENEPLPITRSQEERQIHEEETAAMINENLISNRTDDENELSMISTDDFEGKGENVGEAESPIKKDEAAATTSASSLAPPVTPEDPSMNDDSRNSTSSANSNFSLEYSHSQLPITKDGPQSFSRSQSGDASYFPADPKVQLNKYGPQQQNSIHLLEYELNHCKRVIKNLEKGHEEDQLLIRDVASRVTESCLKRANSEWELEKCRNQLIGYKVSESHFFQFSNKFTDGIFIRIVGK